MFSDSHSRAHRARRTKLGLGTSAATLGVSVRSAGLPTVVTDPVAGIGFDDAQSATTQLEPRAGRRRSSVFF
ncbi:hypothetical protein BH10ACT7_BH10ACT7_17600 [soil metagenome]